jgi:hypothetical protein
MTPSADPSAAVETELPSALSGRVAALRRTVDLTVQIRGMIDRGETGAIDVGHLPPDAIATVVRACDYTSWAARRAPLAWRWSGSGTTLLFAPPAELPPPPPACESCGARVWPRSPALRWGVTPYMGVAGWLHDCDPDPLSGYWPMESPQTVAALSAGCIAALDGRPCRAGTAPAVVCPPESF